MTFIYYKKFKTSQANKFKCLFSL